MEKGLKFVLMLPLKEMALRRLAVLLLNDRKITDFGADFESWVNNREEKVKYKISKLLLPEPLRKEIIDQVRHFSLEIRKWTENHKRMPFSNGEIDIRAKLFWTSAGTIDYKKTAEALLGCEVLDVETRYRLACGYCLEDYIPLLWEGLPEDRKGHFESRYIIRILKDLEYCWIHILKGEFSVLDCLWRGSDRNLTSFNQWAFEYSAREFNETAAEYFFQKLTHEEREVSVMRTALYLISGFSFICFPGYVVLRYLLSIMTPEQQMETIEKNPIKVLLCFFLMPWQDLLVDNAGVIWPFIRASDYGELLQGILWNTVSDVYRPKSFREFFITSPLRFKKYFVHESWMGAFITPAYCFLVAFFERDDSDSIQCILRSVDVTDRKAIVFNSAVCPLFFRYLENKRPMVKMCLQEAELSKEDGERLKKERPYLRKVIEELYESDATADKEKKGLKRKL